MHGKKWLMGAVLLIGTGILWEAVSAARRSEAAFRAPADSNTGKLRLEMEKSQHPAVITQSLRRTLERMLYRLELAKNGTAQESLTVTISDIANTLCNIEKRLRDVRICRAKISVTLLLRRVEREFSEFKKQEKIPRTAA